MRTFFQEIGWLDWSNRNVAVYWIYWILTLCKHQEFVLYFNWKPTMCCLCFTLGNKTVGFQMVLEIWDVLVRSTFQHEDRSQPDWKIISLVHTSLSNQNVCYYVFFQVCKCYIIHITFAFDLPQFTTSSPNAMHCNAEYSPQLFKSCCPDSNY